MYIHNLLVLPSKRFTDNKRPTWPFTSGAPKRGETHINDILQKTPNPIHIPPGTTWVHLYTQSPNNTQSYLYTTRYYMGATTYTIFLQKRLTPLWTRWLRYCIGTHKLQLLNTSQLIWFGYNHINRRLAWLIHVESLSKNSNNNIQFAFNIFYI